MRYNIHNCVNSCWIVVIHFHYKYKTELGWAFYYETYVNS